MYYFLFFRSMNYGLFECAEILSWWELGNIMTIELPRGEVFFKVEFDHHGRIHHASQYKNSEEKKRTINVIFHCLENKVTRIKYQEGSKSLSGQSTEKRNNSSETSLKS
jgi:hypothetical protein